MNMLTEKRHALPRMDDMDMKKINHHMGTLPTARHYKFPLAARLGSEMDREQMT